MDRGKGELGTWRKNARRCAAKHHLTEPEPTTVEAAPEAETAEGDARQNVVIVQGHSGEGSGEGSGNFEDNLTDILEVIRAIASASPLWKA